MSGPPPANRPKIVVTARTLNERQNIERFLAGYYWADKIIVSDGGSTDGTLAVLKEYPKVTVRHFGKQVPTPHDPNAWMNPEDEHINFAIEQAKQAKADWVVLDDVDCAPNRALRQNARKFIEESPWPEIYVVRFYVWGKDEYFPAMNLFDGQYECSLWAWKPDEVDIVARLDDPFSVGFHHPGNWKWPRTKILPPFVLLHRGWPDPETVQRKLDRYASWGRPQLHPLHDHPFGDLAPLPDYAKE